MKFIVKQKIPKWKRLGCIPVLTKTRVLEISCITTKFIYNKIFVFQSVLDIPNTCIVFVCRQTNV